MHARHASPLPRPPPPALPTGGMTVNGLLMQMQADIAGRRVVRPVVNETTALGAAYAAGLAVGFWRDTAQLKAQWRVGQSWTPAAAPETVALLQARWNAAVKKCMGWTTVGEAAAAAAAASSALAAHHEADHTTGEDGDSAGAPSSHGADGTAAIVRAPSGVHAPGHGASHGSSKPTVGASLYSLVCGTGPAAERARRAAFATLVSVAVGVVAGMAIERAAARQGWWGDRAGAAHAAAASGRAL
jgi:hypothetical protein